MEGVEDVQRDEKVPFFVQDRPGLVRQFERFGFWDPGDGGCGQDQLLRW